MAYQKYQKRTMVTLPVDAPKPTYSPSTYQQAILDWLATGKGNALVQARAGSGKTSTLEMLAHACPSGADILFLAFNKSIEQELSKRMPSHVTCKTFHGLAGNALKRYAESVLKTRLDWKSWVVGFKTANIFDTMYDDTEAVVIRGTVLKLVSLMKAHAMLPDALQTDLQALCDHFDIESEDVDFTTDDIIEMARKVLTVNNKDLRTIDFDDMLYFIVVYNISLATYDYVMVDESQDTNEVQRAILRRIVKPTSRVIAVGDDAQAIYGFRGASSNSMSLIRDEFDCTTLPLSISYRCPASVIRLAQNFVPDILPRDNAPEGTVSYPENFKMAQFTHDNLVVCRNTAPLIRVAYKLIAGRVQCRVMGRDIGAGLVALIKKLSGKHTTLTDLPDRISEYQNVETEKALAKRQEGKAQSIADKCESILALLDSMTSDDARRGIPGLISIINEMFADKHGKMVTLATVHKSKGMESPSVIILDSHLMPSKYARQEWQQQQESNLQYVAITRSLDRLTYVDSKSISA